jgi:hypothetical protein
MAKVTDFPTLNIDTSQLRSGDPMGVTSPQAYAAGKAKNLMAPMVQLPDGRWAVEATEGGQAALSGILAGGGDSGQMSWTDPSGGTPESGGFDYETGHQVNPGDPYSGATGATIGGKKYYVLPKGATFQGMGSTKDTGGSTFGDFMKSGGAIFLAAAGGMLGAGLGGAEAGAATTGGELGGMEAANALYADMPAFAGGTQAGTISDIAAGLGGGAGLDTVGGLGYNPSMYSDPSVVGDAAAAGMTPGQYASSFSPGVGLPKTPPTPPGGGSSGAPPTNTAATPGAAQTGAAPGAAPTGAAPGTAAAPSSLDQAVSNVLQKFPGMDAATAAKIAPLVFPGLRLAAGVLAGNPASDANKAAADAANASTNAAQTTANIAADQWNYYKQNYQPLETNLIQQAQDAGSPEEFARARGAATADVTGAFDTARKNTERQMQSYGINPGSPSYQSNLASTNLAQGATQAGALTQADRNTRNLAYSKALDVVGIGRNIPPQSAAAATNAANAATAASNAATNRGIALNAQNTGMQQQIGFGLDTLGKAAQSWFGGPSQTTYGSGNTYTPSGVTGSDPFANFNPNTLEYAKGGPVNHDAVKSTLMRHGLDEATAGKQASGAHKRYYTPHMKVFADGGGVGRQGMTPPDASNLGQLAGPGTTVSDSIPAQVDGNEPAALSTGEFVMNAEVPELTGEEILTAINDAGLKKRQGLQPQNSNEVPINSGMTAYARGGRVMRSACGL